MDVALLSAVGLLAILALANAQYMYPVEGSQCTEEKLLDPFMVQNLKSKYPKKFSSKLTYGKDMKVLETKYRLAMSKLLARHLKNLSLGPHDFRSLMYQTPQLSAAQSTCDPEQMALLSQRQLPVNYHIPCEMLKNIGISPSGGLQIPSYSPVADRRAETPVYQVPQTLSEDCPWSDETRDMKSTISNQLEPLSLALRAFEILKNVLL